MNEHIQILVVDDDQENLRVVSNFLKEKGYQLALAPDGKTALKILGANKIDLVLLDVMMPEMDGYEVCRLMQENQEMKDIPIIFLTALTEPEDLVKGFRMGGVDYITKPFVKEELFARVKNHVQLKKVRDMLRKSAEEQRNSRDMFMRTMLELSKTISTDY